MTWLGNKCNDVVLKLRTLPKSARRWLTVLAVPALAIGLMVGTLLGPGPLGATGLPMVVGLPLAASGEISDPDLTDALASTSPDDGPSLGVPSGNVAPPSQPASSPPPVTTTPFTTPDPAPIDTSSTDTTDSDTESTPTRTPDDTGDGPDPGTTDPDPEGPTLEGTVVHVNPIAHSYAIADGDATLVAIHASKLPDTGRKVSVLGRELSNGTYAEDGKRDLTGRATTASFAGTVTFSDMAAGVYSVSSRGSSVLVHVPPAAEDPPPVVGSQVTVGVTIDPVPEVEPETGTDAVAIQPTDPASPLGLPDAPVDPGLTPAPEPAPPLCTNPASSQAPDPPDAPRVALTQTKIEVAQDPLGYSNFEGVVQAACKAPAKLILSADDLREGGVDLRFTIPKELDLSEVEAGEAVNVTAEIDEKTQILELSGLSSDQGSAGADDPDAALGDQSVG